VLLVAKCVGIIVVTMSPLLLLLSSRPSHANQVLEFVAFKERLERSHTFATAQAELACLDITQPAPSTSPNAGSGSNAPTSSKEEHSAAAAAAAAASSCPLEQLESLSWQGMRYNADLAARLSWQAPVEGRLGGGVLAWWQQQRRAPVGATEAADGCVGPAYYVRCLWATLMCGAVCVCYVLCKPLLSM
jgi:hypothetical protein